MQYERDRYKQESVELVGFSYWLAFWTANILFMDFANGPIQVQLRRQPWIVTKTRTDQVRHRLMRSRVKAMQPTVPTGTRLISSAVVRASS